MHFSGLANSFDSEAYLRFHPPSGFSDSREFSEAECDRERALDLEVQSVLASGGVATVSVVGAGSAEAAATVAAAVAADKSKIDRDELAVLLAR